MNRTAWARSSSSVPSDRIPPVRNNPTTTRNKGKTKENELPKSKAVAKLESLLAGLRNEGSSKDPKGGCFCQARTHPLSKYTPLCFQCGLVLCSLQAPFYPCPHCASPLLNPSSRTTLIQRISEEISEVLAQEVEQRERERDELQRAAGAFPTLATATGQPEASALQPRKVLSLNSQTRKVMVASYNVKPSVQRHPSTPAEEVVEIRTPQPPRDVDYVKGKAASGGRRWQNLRDDNLVYVPLPTQQSNAESSQHKKKRNRKVGKPTTT
ncbi:putative zinc finger motif, C2HC5-type-domain-containing protein [Hysterangium stoloniferum]|nr:putative zinc finger motif, C2HC5-type-domain-containing protein [Hysterangium stoloniferum]